jgi:hypothetical protein
MQQGRDYEEMTLMIYEARKKISELKDYDTEEWGKQEQKQAIKNSESEVYLFYRKRVSVCVCEREREWEWECVCVLWNGEIKEWKTKGKEREGKGWMDGQRMEKGENGKYGSLKTRQETRARHNHKTLNIRDLYFRGTDSKAH